jgi:hypothetical protein
VAAYSTQQSSKLKGYYKSFISQREILDEEARAGWMTATYGAVQILHREVISCQFEFPDLVPPFIESDFFAKNEDPLNVVVPLHLRQFDTNALRRYLGLLCGRISGTLEDVDSIALIEPLEFRFLKDAQLRSIVIRDYEEAQRGHVSRSWKSVILLCGGLIEALLLDALSREPTKALNAKAAPKGKGLDLWVLSELLSVALELQIVEPIVHTIGNAVRQYRNVIHPAVELRNQMRVDKLEADAAINGLKIVERDLTRYFSAP